jgi:hypothetical protein
MCVGLNLAKLRKYQMARQSSPHGLLMIRPANFGFNSETASSNAFQQNKSESTKDIQQRALKEFDKTVDLLKSNEIDVIVIDDTTDALRPDAIFPNNWISTHEEGVIVTYPMMAANRRVERRTDIIDLLRNKFKVLKTIDLTSSERDEKFLEGTGSIVFDHTNKIAYTCRSLRTDESLLNELCQQLGYTALIFDSVDENGKPIYHTNVMMWMGEKMAGVCLDSVKNEDDQEKILAKLSETNHKVIALSYPQIKALAGNMFEVKNKKGEPFLLMSQTAFQSLLPGQLNEMTKHAEPLVVAIDTIEQYGGGGIRCMVAGMYLPLK